MKTKIISWGITTLIIVSIVFILIGNKSELEGRIIKDEVNTFPVEIAEVKKIEPVYTLKYTAVTEAVNDIELVSETQGSVITIHSRTGDIVNKGSIIAKVDDDLARANYQLAQAAYDKAKLDFKRIETLYEENNVSLDNLENTRLRLKSSEAELITAKKYFDNTSIASPISGVVEKRYVNIGSTLAPGSQVANIVDISRLKILFDAAVEDIIKIKEGEKVKITSALYPQKVFVGEITSVGIKANGARTYSVEAEINNNNKILKAGMYVNVELNIKSNEAINVIPRTALVGSIKDPRVYVLENNKAVIKAVKAGEMISNMIHVTAGLTEGETVIISGQNNIEDGDNVIVNSN